MSHRFYAETADTICQEAEYLGVKDRRTKELAGSYWDSFGKLQTAIRNQDQKDYIPKVLSL